MRDMYLRAKKSLGQNFLIDEEALSDIASASTIDREHCIEVGPGYGALTEYLLQANPVTLDLVELDTDMIAILRERFIQDKMDIPVQIHHQDVLKYVPPYEQYRVIANIPYYITSPILFHFLYDLPYSPDEMVIMMQQEVGEKILAGRAKKTHHSLLSLAMEQVCDDITVVRLVPRTSFQPAPQVDSIVLKFVVKKMRNRDAEKACIALWEKAFVHPRKTLLSNLKSTYPLDTIKKWLVQYGYDERIRAEAIKKEDWMSLLSSLGQL